MFPRLLLGQSVTTTKVFVTGGELVATPDRKPRTRRPPATTPDQRENQLISAAVDLAERQILEGTATSQVITHYLKLGSSRERLEKERIQQENELLKAKVKSLDSAERTEELYKKALAAMRTYSGRPEPDEFE
jgi:hypothetical protein